MGATAVTTMSVVSLIFLLFAVGLGFKKKLNVGFIAMALALVLGRLGGISDKEIIAGFNSSTFVSLCGITFWFAVIQQTGTIELLAKKGVALAGKQQWSIPFLLMFLGFAVAGVGPGAVPAVIVCILAIPLAYEMGVNPMLYCLPPFAGLCAGRLTMLTPEGVWMNETALAQGYSNITMYMIATGLTAALGCTLVVYIWYKGWKKVPKTYRMSELPKFDKNQMLCVLSILALMVLVVGFKMSTPLVAFLLGEILLILNVADEKEAIRIMPWGTIIMVSGVSLLMVIINTLGGIQLLSDMLSVVMSPRTAAAITGITGGMMSWFSSSFGVVFPTLMPTVPGIVENFNGAVYGPSVLASIAICASIAGISPFSSGGSMCISAMSVDKRFNKEDLNKCFVQFFIWAIVFLAVVAFFCLTGIFDLMGAILLK